MIDEKSYSLLKLLYEIGEIRAEDAWSVLGQQYKENQTCPQISALLSDKLISRDERYGKPDGEGGYLSSSSYYIITIAGRAFIEQRRKDRRAFWVPYAITTFVAVASLIVSLIDIFYKG